MSTSGVTNLVVTRDQIIYAALQDLSVLEEGATPSSTAVTKAAFALNLIIKSWQALGIKLWTIDNLTIPLVASQTLYTIGTDSSNSIISDRPLKVIQGFLRNVQVTPNVDIPMQALSRQEYNMMGSKTSPGLINSYFYNPKATYGELNVYLTPDSSTATNYDLIIVVQRPLMTMVSSTDNFDFPSEWFLALKWALMAELSSTYDKTLTERAYIDAKAKLFKDEVEDWDVENASVYFVPDIRMGMNKGFR